MWQRPHTICGYETSTDGSAMQSSSMRHCSEAAQIIHILVNQIWRNIGNLCYILSNLCYILSMLRAQLWACLICDGFTRITWGKWTKQSTRLLSRMGPQPQIPGFKFMEPWAKKTPPNLLDDSGDNLFESTQ